jgi:hypothetical protein
LAHGRLTDIRTRLETITGRRVGEASGPRRRGNESSYLLSGFARCAVCGGGLGVTSRSHGRERAFFYACTAHHKRGSVVCGNGLVLAMGRVDDAVLTTLGGDVLRPQVVLAVLDGVLEAMSPRTRARDVDDLRSELAGLDRELARLSNAIAAGGELGPLLAALKVRQARRDEVIAALAARKSFDVERFDRKGVEAKVREYVAGWRALLTSIRGGGGVRPGDCRAGWPTNCSGVPNGIRTRVLALKG